MKITAYVVEDQRFVQKPVDSPADIPEKAVWIDVTDPNREQVLDLADRLGLFVEIDEDEFRFDVFGHVEVEGQQLMMLLQAERSSDGLPSGNGILVVSADKLVTFRNGSVPAAELLARSIEDMAPGSDPRMQLVIQVLASAMEVTSKALDAAEAEVHRSASEVLSSTDAIRAEVDLEQVLSSLGRLQVKMVELRYRHRLIGRVVEILQRDRRFVLPPELEEDLELAASDAQSLGDFAGSIDEQLSRLMDSTIGFIGLRQNVSARWFSIVATVFMPPTLLGAIWGMNFEYMPELDERYAYAIALGLMLLSATIPLWVVRKMGWLS